MLFFVRFLFLVFSILIILILVSDLYFLYLLARVELERNDEIMITEISKNEYDNLTTKELLKKYSYK